MRDLALWLCLATAFLACDRGEGGREARIAQLEAQHRVLAARLVEATASEPRLHGAPAGDVLLMVPAPLLQRLVERVSVHYLDRVRLDIRDVEAHVEEKIKGGGMTLGVARLDVRIEEARGTLTMAEPRLALDAEGVALAATVRLTAGAGRAEVRLRWDGRGLAGAVCGDLDATRSISGEVRPEELEVRGRLNLGLEDGWIRVVPELPPLRAHLRVQPTPGSWQSIEELLADRSAACRLALKTFNVRGKLRDLVERGFDVKLPTAALKPVTLPFAVVREIEGPERDLRVRLAPAGLSLDAERLWVGASLAVSRGGGSGTAGQP